MEFKEVSKLKTNPNNPRGEVAVDDALRELADSIREQGVLQPILVTPDGTIVAGHRRVKACELIALRAIPVIVRDLNEAQQIQIMLIENLQREDLSILQTAKAYHVLTKHGLSIAGISKATGFSTGSISTHLQVLSLPKELHSAFDGELCLPLGGLRFLLELAPADQLRIGKLAIQHRWTIAAIAQAVTEAKGSKRRAEAKQQDENASGYHIRNVLDRLEEMDRLLDKFEECRSVQSLIRVAIARLVDILQQKRKPISRAKFAGSASSQSASTLYNEGVPVAEN